MIKRREYANDYYQKNKEKKKEYSRNYHQNNKEKLKEKRNSENFKQIRKKHDRNYYYKNKEKILENRRIYNQNNKEKGRESNRKYREKKKNEKENLKNEISKLRNIQSEINGGTSFVLPQNNDSPKASDNLTNTLNDGAESSASPQNQEYKETLKTTSKNETKIHEDEKKFWKKVYNKEKYQKNKFPSNEGNLLANTQNNECESKEKEPIVSKENIQLEKGEDVEVNDNAEEGEDTSIQSSDNLEGIGNAEATSFVNPQTDDCVNNLSDTNACPSGQPNVQSSVGLHTQQMADHDDLIDMSLLDDSDFMDYLNYFLNS
uniref:Uncharacterized protein n=2 Tax=Meloidogyne TaxID=189290 RepID=A0A6V7V947_MELEN|nr:unnamed protein product [Meloidogyne enterolobii]CAD2171333.1 unnamed protein product [Meloidogyne enterolobii]